MSRGAMSCVCLIPGSIGEPTKFIVAGIPADRRFTAQTPDLHHKIERGESLSVIAARYGTSVSELVAMNGLQSRHRIRAGQVLNLPYQRTRTDRRDPQR